MNRQTDCRQQSRIPYVEPDVEFAEVDPVWCETSLDPIRGENETPLIFM